ncbi:MAG: response regulator [Pseudomonadota bacterium]|nr:response regulator [Pseudomonadota bacterium]
MATAGNGLSGLRVLVVEDEFYLADDIAQALTTAGARVVGPVGSFEEAAAAVAKGGIDRAVLDMNLKGEMAFPIADRLEEAGIPFVITTGYSSASLPDRLRDKPRLEKPFDPEALTQKLLPGRE